MGQLHARNGEYSHLLAGDLALAHQDLQHPSLVLDADVVRDGDGRVLAGDRPPDQLHGGEDAVAEEGVRMEVVEH